MCPSFLLSHQGLGKIGAVSNLRRTWKRTTAAAGAGAAAAAAWCLAIWLAAVIEDPGHARTSSLIFLLLVFGTVGATIGLAAVNALQMLDNRHARLNPPPPFQYPTWTSTYTNATAGKLASMQAVLGTMHNAVCLRTVDGELVSTGTYGPGIFHLSFPYNLAQLEAGKDYVLFGHPEGRCDCPRIAGQVIPDDVLRSSPSIT